MCIASKELKYFFSFFDNFPCFNLDHTTGDNKKFHCQYTDIYIYIHAIENTKKVWGVDGEMGIERVCENKNVIEKVLKAISIKLKSILSNIMKLVLYDIFLGWRII
jgi:hypothetical protein